jgi:hypothetical protein
MQPIFLMSWSVLVMPWLLTILWFTFFRKKRALFIIASAPWFLAFFALLTFSTIAEHNLAADGPDAGDTGVGFGYIAFILCGFFFALLANILSATLYLIYRQFSRLFAPEPPMQNLDPLNPEKSSSSCQKSGFPETPALQPTPIYCTTHTPQINQYFYKYTKYL